ncbi:MAG: RluA family pseudouridine synthase [Alphaproteobacteria bacterium]|nr:RluA family pseudouridine synthase [Alphaproteobacteria bacterium]
MPKIMNIFTTTEVTKPERLDIFLSQALEKSRSFCQKIIKEGCVFFHNDPKNPIVSASHKVAVGDIYDVHMPELKEARLVAEDIPLAVVFEDEDIIVVNKPAGLVVHPAPGHHTGTLVHALLHHCKDQLSGVNGEKKPGILHRLDRFTSGLIVIAKHDQAHHHLAEQIATRTAKRIYIAFCQEELFPKAGVINKPIGRHHKHRLRMAVTQKGRESITNFHTICCAITPILGRISLIQCSLETGRTHQIRVHLSHQRNSVLNDTLYGARALQEQFPLFAEGQQALHAAELHIIHPKTNEALHFTAPASPAMRALYEHMLQAQPDFKASKGLAKIFPS